MAAETKHCPGCKLDLPFDSFTKATASLDGLAWRCRDCLAAQHQTRRAADPDYIRKRHLKARYNLTLDEYKEMLSKQGGRCLICRCEPGSRALHVDHDHSCCPGMRTCGGCIRGILCDDCNRGIGMFQDDPDLLIAASYYLMRSK